MQFTKQQVKSCCGKTAFVYTLDRGILPAEAAQFTSKGFLVPERYSKNGFFYCRKGILLASCSFGVKKMSVKCSSSTSSEMVDFDSVLSSL